MSQFMLCKSAYDLTEQKCVRAVHNKDNKELYYRVIKDLFGEVSKDIWVVPDIDCIFTQAQKYNSIYSFETTELYTLLSMLYDVSEVLILWYSDEYSELDNVTTKEQFFSLVKESIAEPTCECYVYVKK